jgi:mRNA interferase RelE/StbE
VASDVANSSLGIKRSALKELTRLPRKDRGRVVSQIRALAAEPRPIGAERLSGRERYRVRQGNHRILYEIEDAVLRIMVVRIGHRRDVHRG